MTALEEYERQKTLIAVAAGGHVLEGWVKRNLADAAIAELQAAVNYWQEQDRVAEHRVRELQAEVERLKCCGNCGNYGDRGEDYNCAATDTGHHGHHPPRIVDPADHCYFTPSRWVACREES